MALEHRHGKGALSARQPVRGDRLPASRYGQGIPRLGEPELAVVPEIEKAVEGAQGRAPRRRGGGDFLPLFRVRVFHAKEAVLVLCIELLSENQQLRAAVRGRMAKAVLVDLPPALRRGEGRREERLKRETGDGDKRQENEQAGFTDGNKEPGEASG